MGEGYGQHEGLREANDLALPSYFMGASKEARGRERKGPSVNVSSTASKKGWPNATAYAASKHGLMGLTQALHAEGKEHGVRVMAVVAGGMRTNFFRTLDPPPPPENLQPPENVAACILFMVCQPEESVIQELIVTPMTETSYP
jgi:NAD(P)-dependent dehydrogenase (short-subunit alcohol dehydrogenase family)